MEENLTNNNYQSKKERKELKRQDRRAELKKMRLAGKARKIGRWIVILAALAALGYGMFYFFDSGQSAGPDFSEAIPILNRNHVNPGTTIENYNSNPPTSGQHWPSPTSRGVHNEEISDEILVHNLEHGEVWISYRPGIPEEALQALRAFARDFSKIVVTPRGKNDTDIALAAWGRLDKFNLEGGVLDEDRVRDFVRRYRNKGPEIVP